MTEENFILKKEAERYKHYESMEWKIRHETALQIIKKLPKGKVLEIGCADGGYLKRLKQLGFDVYGLDIYPKWIKKCKTKHINISFGDANNNLPYKDNSFDYIVNFEMIAHLITPIHFIREIKRVLKKEGKFIIESVNSAHWKYRISYLLAQTNNYGLLWSGFKGYNTHYNMIWPEHKSMHLQHFSLNSCKEMLEDNGFQVTDYSNKMSPNKSNRLTSTIHPNLFCTEYIFLAKH